MDIVRDKTHLEVGWGVQLSGNIQPTKPLVLYYQCTYGQGIGNYIKDLNGLTLAYIPKDSEPGKMTTTPMMGFLLGATYSFSPKIDCGIMYSQARVWDSGTYYPSYRYGQYAAVNMLYKITSYLKYGVEYIWGQHATFGDKACNTRIQTTLQLSL